MERIYQLYSTLPTIFANDIARRQNGMGRRSQSPSVSLKRDRTDEYGTDIGNKRRDTGEHKLSSLPTSPSNQPPTSFTASSTASTPQPVTPSVSMGPPSHVPPNSDPRRQMAAMRPPMQPQQNSQPMIQPNNMQPNHTAVQPTNTSTNAVPANIPPHIAAMGSAAVQYYQVLQNPTHPMVQYITNSIPGFQSLPINQQIIKMHQVQVGFLVRLPFLYPYRPALDSLPSRGTRLKRGSVPHSPAPVAKAISPLEINFEHLQQGFPLKPKVCNSPESLSLKPSITGWPLQLLKTWFPPSRRRFLLSQT